MVSNSAISRRIEAIEAEAAKKAAKQEAKQVVDWGKLSDAAREELRTCRTESGELDYRKVSTATLEELLAAFRRPDGSAGMA